MANPNPSPETRFGGARGNRNPGGKTKEQVKAERAAAHKAAILRDKMLSAIMEKVEAGEDVLEHLSSDALKLFKDSEDRAHGTPKSTSDTKVTGDVNARLTLERAVVRPKDKD